MELKIVEDGESGVRRLDTSVVEQNVEKYSVEKRGLKSALERTKFELGNAEKILRIMGRLSKCGLALADKGDPLFFFFTQDRYPAVPTELMPEEYSLTTPWGFKIVPMEDLLRVQCPGCPEMRILAGRQSCYGWHYIEFVICGNSLHIIKEEYGKSFFQPS